MPKGIRVLFFGATSFVGTNLLLHILKQREIYGEVTVVTRDASKIPDIFLAHDNLICVQQDISLISEDLINLSEFDLILYFAAEVNFYGGKEILDQNVIPLCNILKLMSHNFSGKFVFASTLGAIDRHPLDRCQSVLTPSSKYYPSSIYGISKAKCEILLKNQKWKFQTLVVRLPWCYGPRMRPNHHIPLLTLKSKSLNPIFFFNWPGRISVFNVRNIGSQITSLLNQNWDSFGILHLADEYSPSFGELFKAMGMVHKKKRGYIPIPKYAIRVFNFISPLLPFSARCLFSNQLLTKGIQTQSNQNSQSLQEELSGVYNSLNRDFL